MSAADLTDEELRRVICAVRNHADVSQWYELVPRCYTPCGWVGLLETAPNGGPRKEQFAAHWQEQVANELRPIIAAHVRRALEDAAEKWQDPDFRRQQPVLAYIGLDIAIGDLAADREMFDREVARKGAEAFGARAAAVAPRENGTKDE